MIIMIELFNTILKEFTVQNSDELLSMNFSSEFDNHIEFLAEGKKLATTVTSDVLKNRKAIEINYHQFLKHQMFYKLQEMKSYSTVNIMDTRRLIATSNDCISSIHMLIRDEIHLNVYFRSSDVFGALPIDLEFISSLPSEFIHDMTRLTNYDGFEEIDSSIIKEISNKKIKLNLMFGSLHYKQNVDTSYDI